MDTNNKRLLGEIGSIIISDNKGRAKAYNSDTIHIFDLKELPEWINKMAIYQDQLGGITLNAFEDMGNNK